MDKIGVIGIIITDRQVVPEVQALLSDFSEIILGRMGIPDRDHGIQAISIVVEGPNEKISALSGKLGRLNNVVVKSAVTNIEIK
ncbi:MAG: iron-only hydrogenase system regulator [Clostridia bacterium]|nr:iron-only hydrogenase system regulator [Clostridia bacterium]